MLFLLAVIAESFERIHRSNLVGMGIVPLQFLEGQSARSLGLNGKEKFTIVIPEIVKPGQLVSVKVYFSIQFSCLQLWLLLVSTLTFLFVLCLN